MRTLLDIDRLGLDHFLAGGVAGPPESFVGSPEPATPPDVEERKKSTPAVGRKARPAATASPSSRSKDDEDNEDDEDNNEEDKEEEEVEDEERALLEGLEEFLDPTSPKEQGEGSSGRPK